MAAVYEIHIRNLIYSIQSYFYRILLQYQGM